MAASEGHILSWFAQKWLDLQGVMGFLGHFNLRFKDAATGLKKLTA